MLAKEVKLDCCFLVCRFQGTSALQEVFGNQNVELGEYHWPIRISIETEQKVFPSALYSLKEPCFIDFARPIYSSTIKGDGTPSELWIVFLAV